MAHYFDSTSSKVENLMDSLLQLNAEEKRGSVVTEIQNINSILSVCLYSKYWKYNKLGSFYIMPLQTHTHSPQTHKYNTIYDK